MSQVKRLLSAFIFLPLLAMMLVLIVGLPAWLARMAAAWFPDHTAAMLSNLDAIPTVVWAAFAASGLTLSGVYLSDTGQTDRLVLQLEHDTVKSERDRTTSLRRDVYLQAAGELTLAGNWLAALPAKDPTQENAAEGLQGFFVAATKLQVIAETRTAALASELVATYGDLLVRLLVDVIPMQELRIENAVHLDFYRKEREETVRILSEMGRMMESGRIDKAVFDALDESLNFHESRAEHFEAERSKNAEVLKQLQITFCRRFFNELKVLSRSHVPVMAAIRSDLGLSGDLAVYQEQLEANARRMEAGLDELLRRMEHG